MFYYSLTISHACADAGPTCHTRGVTVGNCFNIKYLYMFLKIYTNYLKIHFLHSVHWCSSVKMPYQLRFAKTVYQNIYFNTRLLIFSGQCRSTKSIQKPRMTSMHLDGEQNWLNIVYFLSEHELEDVACSYLFSRKSSHSCERCIGTVECPCERTCGVGGCAGV